jgi:hypothetical protein
MAIAMFKHTPVGKSTQAQPYTAAAHARYMMRKGAAMKVFSENMPVNWHAVQRYLKQHEDGLRKNGRVADKFIIAVPREVSPEDAESVLRRYGKRIGEGKAPFIVALHWEENNPHAHMIFLDRDPATGKRVFGTSEMRSTELLKFNWADEVNQMFASLGVSISFDSTTESLQEAFNDNNLPPDEEVSNDLPPETLPPEPVPAEVSEPSLAEPEVAEIAEDDYPIVQDASANPMQAAYAAAVELRRIRHIQGERDYIKARYQSAYASHQSATLASTQAVAALALAEVEREKARSVLVEEHTGIFGRKKGFSVGAFGYTYTSPARKAADAAEQAYKVAQTQSVLQLEVAQREHANFGLVSQDFNKAEKDYQDIQGTEQEISDAEKLHEDTVNYHVGNLSPDDIKDLVMENALQPQEAALLLDTLGYPEAAKDYSEGRSY